MKDIIKNSATNNLRPVILIAPLDWGLGHATRCVPLIRYMITLNYKVIIAGEGPQMALLKQEFPSVQCVFLRGYRLKYASSGSKTILKIILQIPKILIAIKNERRWLAQFLMENKVNAVISDNRYGLFTKDIPAVFITHQLHIKTSQKGIGEGLVQKINYRFINKFSECWVPDFEKEPNLAGELSHPRLMPAVPVKYLGVLSRLLPATVSPVYELLIIISGPEPQRTLFEQICLQELGNYHAPVMLIRGLPDSKEQLPGFNSVTIFNHLPAAQMGDAINRSGIIISRSGYSTVMEMMTLQKKCIFIPTPGQSEQLYLANYLADKSHCLFYRQHAFSLANALNEMKAARLIPFNPVSGNDYRNAIKDLLR